MADVVDEANDLAERERADQVAKIREKARLDPGQPGTCELCGEEFSRLINGVCGRCRDKYGLP